MSSGSLFTNFYDVSRTYLILRSFFKGQNELVKMDGDALPILSGSVNMLKRLLN